MQLLQQIGTPEQAHGVTTPDEYRAFALNVYRSLLPRQERVNVALRQRKERPIARVNHGRWVIDCDCGNCPSAHPEWELAICPNCGSEYRPKFPKDREAVERVLLARARPDQRHFFPDRGVAKARGLKRRETLRDLIQENAERGVSVVEG